MRPRVSPALAAAGWLLAAASTSCSHEKKAAAAPAPPPEPTAAEMSQKSFQLAAEEQRALTEQQKKVEAAHASVVAAQDNLLRAQATEEQERAKIGQLQQQTSQHLQEGVQQAQRAQANLSGGMPQGLQTVAGSVTQATPSQVAIQTPGGRSMTFTVNDRTRVLLGTETRSIADVQRGADAQVAYDPKAGQMTALIIRVMPAAGAATNHGQQQQQQLR